MLHREGEQLELHGSMHIKIYFIINAFFLYWTYPNFFCMLEFASSNVACKNFCKSLCISERICVGQRQSLSIWIGKCKGCIKKAFKLCHLHLIYFISFSSYLSSFVLNHILSWLSDLRRSMGRRRWIRRKPRNHLTRIVSMAPINIQMVAMDIQVHFLCVFYFPLKCDPLEETPKKAADYAYHVKVRRLSKWDSIFKATCDCHDQHAWCAANN